MDIHTSMHAAISAAIINNLKLHEDKIHLSLFFGDTRNDAWSRNFFRVLFEGGVFEVKDFRDAVVEGVKVCGLEMYDCVVLGEYPDHVVSPPALAYVLENCDASLKMARNIRFDHDETLGQFKSRADGLIDNVMDQLANL